MLSRFSWGLAIVIAAVASSARAEILFLDNFDSTSDASAYGDYGLNQELDVRQSGTAGQIQYVKPTVAQSRFNAKVNDAAHPGLLSFILDTDWQAGSRYLDHDFGVNVKVSATIQPNTNTAGTGWTALAMLTSSNNPSYKEIPYCGDVGAAIQLVPNGTWWAFSNGGNFASGNVTTATTYDVTMQVTNTGSGNVLNAWIGDTQIVTDYVLSGAAATRTVNYVGMGGMMRAGSSFGGTQFATFDNLKVETASAVPEPGTLALLAAGLIGLVAYAWRKR
ncbi:MAG: PEP-CTERM sorting domain-containing protein [Thermoguttaceae bacterium]